MRRDNRLAFAGLYDRDCSALFSAPGDLTCMERLAAIAAYEVLLRRALHRADGALPYESDDPLTLFPDTDGLAGLSPEEVQRIFSFLQNAGLIETDTRHGFISFPHAALHGSIVLPGALRNRRYRRKQKEKTAADTRTEQIRVPKNTAKRSP